MSEQKFTFLCGGVLFFMLMKATYPDGSARDHREGIKDEHKAPDVMSDLVYTFTGSRSYGSEKDTSNYRECKSEGTVNAPFNDESIISAYESTVKNQYAEALGRMQEFCRWHINPAMKEWLVRALLEVIEFDKGIKDSDSLYILDDGSCMDKATMKKTGDYELEPFLVGALYFILLILEVGKMSGEMVPANKYSPAPADVSQTGDTNVHVTNQQGGTVNINYNFPEKSGGGDAARAMAIQSFSREYYQLIVTCEEDVFENDVVTVSTNRALCESLVPPEIYERCSALTDEGKEELKRIPAIICQENTDMHGITDPKQMAIYAYITRIRKSGKQIKIAFKPIAPFFQIKMCSKRNAVYFDLDMDCAITDLNHIAWSVHKVKLFEAFEEAGIPNMPAPL